MSIALDFAGQLLVYEARIVTLKLTIVHWRDLQKGLGSNFRAVSE